MKTNKDLPKDEQMRIVLQNYDKKQAECDALKKENESLRKQLSQKDVLYKNMLDHFNGVKGASVSNANWEARYNQLKEAYDKRTLAYQTIHNQLQKTRSVLDSVRGKLCDAYNRVEDYCAEIGIEHTAVVSQNGEGSEYNLQGNKSNATTRDAKFVRYVRDLISVYGNTGTLRGISVLAMKYGVPSMTKEQFFRFGFDKEEEITDDEILNAYLLAKKH